MTSCKSWLKLVEQFPTSVLCQLGIFAVKYLFVVVTVL